MKEFLLGSVIGTAAGFVIGGIMVARDKKLSSKINSGIEKAEEKLKETKDATIKKLKECKVGEEEKSESCDCDPTSKVCC